MSGLLSSGLHSVLSQNFTASFCVHNLSTYQGLLYNEMYVCLRWEEQGYFKPVEGATGEPFTICAMPQPVLSLEARNACQQAHVPTQHTTGACQREPRAVPLEVWMDALASI